MATIEIVIIILVYFAVGGLATWLANRKSSKESARNNWIKLVLYFFIVFAMIAAISYGLQRFVGYVIVAIGAYEVVKVWLSKKGASPMILLFALVVYVAIGYFFIVFMNQDGPVLQLLVYVFVLVFDGFSQTTGRLFGKTKLVPSISPGKTLEGLIGGLVVTFITARLAMPPHSDWFGITFMTCLFAFGGDLLASYYKRKCGVKDYSNLIPGHGGVLDRFDSFLLAGALWSIVGLYAKPFLHG
jgi:phosphatidate cytidylyltransferase